MSDKYEAPKRYTALNDVTGDLIKSRTDGQDKFAEGWDRIFGKKKEDRPHVIEYIDNIKCMMDNVPQMPICDVCTRVGCTECQRDVE